MRPLRPLLAAALVVGYGAVAGCSGAGSTSPPAGHEHLPGQADHTHPSTSAPADAVSPAGSAAPAWNHDDVSYLQMTIPHHGQALDLAELAATRAADRRVRALATRVQAARGPETWLMAGWLAERGIDVPSPQDDPHDYDHGDHGHHPMRGLLDDDELAELAAADGAAFDRLFLGALVRHHRGAIAMAGDVLADGTDPRVAEIAEKVAAGQGAEVTRMERILAELE
ncbi:DUF305 domain-containing protein [Nocardioides sp. W7]|uniref:DUF305 domain-containing protein n=1 Tax=Nocardioides sp. W7 TaxID=2931390 RepID=UPI001FD4466E|nr:DUF305 domain-containing protein [Nocardioides sp. W7]